VASGAEIEPELSDAEAPTLAAIPCAASPTTHSGPSASMIGRDIIGQYVIEAKLGEGGMGEVYLAEQPAIGRKVAIKVVHSQLRVVEEQAERFRNEAKAAASLSSPHIVEIFNWGELDDGTLFMAMEYLRGQTLAELLDERGPLEPELAVAIATQICAALSEAHAAGIVHRDLKPSNVMLLERDGHEGYFVKVLDFGVAKLEGADITASGAMFGTPQYMSPEQLRAGTIDGRSDLYALGVMLYEMLSGELPFRSPSAIGYITAHLHDQPPALPGEVPRALAEVVELLLAKNADERPRDANATAAELRAALGGRSPAARRRARRRALRSGLAVMIVSAVIAALGLSAWQLWRWQNQTELELERERERALALEQRVREQEAAVALAREQAQALAEQQLESSTEVRRQREDVQQRHLERDGGDAPRELDAKTRAMLTRSRAQLEDDLRAVLDARRIPPSEIDDLWRSHAERVAAVAAGELAEHELREELASMIELYRKGFDRKRAGDDLPLDQLERRFMTMASEPALSEDDRQAMIDAIYETYEARELSDDDRTYFKQLALAKLIREHTPDDPGQAETAALPKPEGGDQAEREDPQPKPKSASSGASAGPAPAEGETGSTLPLPSLDDP